MKIDGKKKERAERLLLAERGERSGFEEKKGFLPPGTRRRAIRNGEGSWEGMQESWTRCPYGCTLAFNREIPLCEDEDRKLLQEILNSCLSRKGTHRYRLSEKGPKKGKTSEGKRG